MDRQNLIFEQIRRRRLRLIIVLLITGGLFYTGARLLGWFVLRPILGIFDPEALTEIISVLGFFILMLALGLMLNIYLRYGPSYFRTPDEVKEDIRKNGEPVIEALISRLDGVENQLTQARKLEGPPLPPEQYKTILDETLKCIKGDAAADILGELKQEVAASLKTEREKCIRARYESMVRRLSSQLEQLTRRGNLNLVFGILATLSGFLIFWYLIPDLKISAKEPIEIAGQFVPRFSLVILIEIFAYFFLGLYRSSLAEIKYFQNELTNVESKLLALEYAASAGNATALKGILENLAATERNFLLKKGETTVQLEQERMLGQEKNSLLAKLDKLLDSKPKADK